MARTRTTIRRIDPWSILKFGFVANLVLLGIQLLAGAVLWYVIQRLELIQTVCELAGTVGFEECGVDGGALFDTFLVLGLLGVVIQTGILVFLTFLANLIFDLTGGIAITLDDEVAPPRGPNARAAGAASLGGSRTGSRRGSRDASEERRGPPAPLGSRSRPSDRAGSTDDRAVSGTSGSDERTDRASGSAPTPATSSGSDSQSDTAAGGSSSDRDDDTLFGSRN